jgi:hypothetical protein
MATASTIPAIPKTRSYWSDKRPNGQPLEAGVLCWMTEIEGENPIPTYGRSVEEVLNKVSYTLGHSQAELARRGAAGYGPRSTGVAPPPPPVARQRMSANDVMQAFSEATTNPGKSGDAIVRLVQDATGVDLRMRAFEDFETRAKEWVEENPDFYDHPGNRDIVTRHAMRAVGGDAASVSKELLTTKFRELQQQGLLFERPAAPAPAVDQAFPGESPVQRVEYPRGGRPGTGPRSTSFRATQTMQPRTPKYSDDDIRKMPASEKKRLIETNDRDYAEACDRMYERAKASA